MKEEVQTFGRPSAGSPHTRSGGIGRVLCVGAAGASPGELAAIVTHQVLKWARVMRETGLQPD